MDKADSIEVSELDGEGAGAERPRRPRRRLHALAEPERSPITSDLRVDEPVLDDEIRLILAVLGDTITQILNTNTACPTSTAPGDV